MRDIELWFLWLMVYSFIGWLYESALCSVTDKKLVNRGFLTGPLCPIYGVGAITVLWLLAPLKDNLIGLFFTSALLTTVLEYLTSWLMETLFHARWWDYSKRFANIHGRVCLLGFIAFGAMAVLVVEFVHPWLSGLTARLDQTQLHILCAVLAAFFMADLALTLVTVLGLENRLREFLQALENHTIYAKGLHAFQLRRLSVAFPRMQSKKYPAAFERVRERIRTLREEKRTK